MAERRGCIGPQLEPRYPRQNSVIRQERSYIVA
jgi:hypothetical protein